MTEKSPKPIPGTEHTNPSFLRIEKVREGYIIVMEGEGFKVYFQDFHAYCKEKEEGWVISIDYDDSGLDRFIFTSLQSAEIVLEAIRNIPIQFHTRIVKETPARRRKVMQFDSIEDTFKYLDHSLDGMDLYEFGVYRGHALWWLSKGFKEKNIPIREVWGFDSFEGLPPEKPGIQFHEDWQPGVFDAREHFGVATKEEAMQKVQEYVKEQRPEGVNLIPGWFSDTLKDNLVAEKDMRAAAYIHVDTDLYISSIQALDFCFREKLAVPGTILRYDDVLAVPWGQGSQSLAHIQIEQRYKVDFERLSYNVFRVLN